MTDQDQNLNQDPQGHAPAEDELAKCERERDEYLGGWQRAKADFANYKREEMRRIEELARYQTEDLIRDLITVLDNFDLTLGALSQKTSSPPAGAGEDGVGIPAPKAIGIQKGIYMIRTQIEDILKQRGVEKIPIKPGDDFDPSVAEAIAEGDPDPMAAGPPGSVLEVIETGYRLFGKVIRPARVKVVKSP